MLGQDSLSVSDPLYNVPWHNFLLNSAIILGITFSIPVCTNMLRHSFRPDSKFDPEMFNFFHMAPWTFAVTLLVGVSLDCCNTRVQKFFRVVCCCKSAKVTDQEPGQDQPLLSSGTDQDGRTVQSPKCCTSSRWNCLVWFKLLAFSLLPLITWSSPMIWLDGVAEAYVGCAFACDATGHIKRYKDIEFCRNVTSFSDMIAPGKTKWPKAKLQSSFGTKSPKAVLKICESIFEGKRTKWALEMQGRNMFFVTFEALLRQHYQISSVEVFGSLLGGVVIVLWLVIDAALSIKTKELVTYRNTFLRQTMMVKVSTIEKYAKLFLHLDSLQRRTNGPVTKEYSSRILKTAMDNTIMDKDENVEDAVYKVFQMYEDADGDGIDDQAQVGCSWSCLRRDFACALLALVHISVPAVVKLFLKRRKSLLHHHSFASFLFEECPSAFLTHAQKIKPAILCNLIVGFVAYFLLFRALVVAFERYRRKFDQLLAFRCMWRFPDENPLDDVDMGGDKMSTCALIREIKEIQQQEKQDVEGQATPYMLTRAEDEDKHLLSGGAAAGGGPLKQRLYRFDFSHRFFPKLFEEVPRLSEWYNMRRYIQIDCVDERIATEMYSTLAVVCLLWKLVMVLLNWVSMNSDSDRKLQTVNFESLYDAAVIAVLLLLSLTLTLQFNDEFARHGKQVSSLQEHLKLVHAGESIKSIKRAKSQASLAAGETEADDQATEADKYIATICDGVQKFDRPATIFGFSVNRELIGGVGSFVAISAAPVALRMMQSIVLSDTEGAE